jgi:phosphoribosylamine--glycine ligase
MKVLIVGGGGREHALAWKCIQSPRVTEVLVAPGNAGTALEHRVRNIAVDADDIDALVNLARSELVDLTIVGPETPLVAGIVDRFRAEDLQVFGPNASAARLEGSKAFTKSFLKRYRIPTAAYESFTDLQAALRHIRQREAPMVVKADGLAAGKGVVVARSVDEAERAARDMLAGGAFGKAGQRRATGDIAGSQGAGRRRHGPEYRRDGRVLAGAGRDPRTGTAHHGRNRSADAGRAA